MKRTGDPNTCGATSMKQSGNRCIVAKLLEKVESYRTRGAMFDEHALAC